MKSTSEGGGDNSTNDDNGHKPRTTPLSDEFRPTKIQAPPPSYQTQQRKYKPRVGNSLSFSLTRKQLSKSTGSQSSSSMSNVIIRPSSSDDLESQGSRLDSSSLGAANIQPPPPIDANNKRVVPSAFSTAFGSHGGATSPTNTAPRKSIFKGGGLIVRRQSGEGSVNGSERSGESNEAAGCEINSHNNYHPQPSHNRKRSTFRLPPLFSPHTTPNTTERTNDSENTEITDDYGYHSNTLSSANTTNTRTSTMRQRLTTFKRFGVNDFVLITNHDIPLQHNSNNSTNSQNHNQPQLVNRYGYPEDYTNSTNTSTPLKTHERRGPYIYLIARVISIHYGENIQYYTVKRYDGQCIEQRSDVQYMELLNDTNGIDAAIYTAQKSNKVDDEVEFGTSFNNQYTGLLCLQPCIASITSCTKSIHSTYKKIYTKTKKQMDSCLNGNRPYGISCRFTSVNFFVLCSIWYLYIDQLRLAFMPHSADYACAVLSAIVWLVLFLELVMEVFIRPSGYYKLRRSEKAYLPSTVRYLNSFHLVTEMISLIFFIPEFMCLFSPSKSCGDRYSFSLANACLMSLYGPDRIHAFYGTAFICIMRLRIFGLVRHWCKMWINNTFVRVRGKNGEWRVQRGKGLFVPQGHRGGHSQESATASTNHIAIEESVGSSTRQISTTTTRRNDNNDEKKNEFTNDYHLTNASKIGTALFTTNAKRGLIFVFLTGLAPLVPVCFQSEGGTNQQIWNSVELLQTNNLELNDYDDCGQLETTVVQWIKTNAFETDIAGDKKQHLLSLVVRPIRCEFQTGANNGGEVGTLAALYCRDVEPMAKCSDFFGIDNCSELCLTWAGKTMEDRLDLSEFYFGVRPSTTLPAISDNVTSTVIDEDGVEESADFYVTVLFNEALSVRRTIIYLFAMQLGMTIFVLLGLSVMRFDAGRLVLGPLRRMLKIVAFYAKHPLSPPPQKSSGTELSVRSSFQKQNEAYYYESDDESADAQLGTFETEQLINAVTKITDLLRKCWGVAGADIISSNLARQEGGLTTYFNPTVPGKAVYALFAFATIDNFQGHLHALKGDIMILINDIAAVLHEEVYRWGYEDSGQCNKNLGSTFLMVYKIGAVSEVVEKRERAEAVIFQGKNTAKARRRRNTRRITDINQLRKSSIGGSTRGGEPVDKLSRSHVDNLDLSSLPGMRTFSDRALLGLLKTFASIHRDKTILNWNNDFRLGAGVGAVSINLNFGMDAGWAVEGAVGSSYKIDATYLSPHVNMAARMMSATKQYGVYFLLSQAVQKLLSENAQDKLRHIDTVTVKGSSVQQKIFTYDAKVRDDFFLYSKSENQADLDSDRYSPAIWETDQDLLAMRNHVSGDFMEVFNRGRDEYLAGNWPTAIRLLKKADKIMFEREVDEGYTTKTYEDNLKSMPSLMDDDPEVEERRSMGDGPCQRLIAYMEENGSEAPSNWSGYRPLTSK